MNKTANLTLIPALLLILAACGSTPDLCDRACSAWNSCIQVEGNTVNYPYDVCYDECIDEGDWGSSYVSCTESYSTCPEIANNCG